MYSTGFCLTAATDSGEGEGAAKNIPQSITDGEHTVTPHESPFISYGNDYCVKEN